MIPKDIAPDLLPSLNLLRSSLSPLIPKNTFIFQWVEKPQSWGTSSSIFQSICISVHTFSASLLIPCWSCPALHRRNTFPTSTPVVFFSKTCNLFSPTLPINREGYKGRNGHSEVGPAKNHCIMDNVCGSNLSWDRWLRWRFLGSFCSECYNAVERVADKLHCMSDSQLWCLLPIQLQATHLTPL